MMMIPSASANHLYSSVTHVEPRSVEQKRERVYGYFQCNICHRKWESSQTWKIDGVLKGQQCNRCEGNWIVPYKSTPLEIPLVTALFKCPFDKSRFTNVMKISEARNVSEQTCPRCMRKFHGTAIEIEGSHIDVNKPHDQQHCQRCKELGYSCAQRPNLEFV